MSFCCRLDCADTLIAEAVFGQLGNVAFLLSNMAEMKTVQLLWDILT